MKTFNLNFALDFYPPEQLNCASEGENFLSLSPILKTKNESVKLNSATEKSAQVGESVISNSPFTQSFPFIPSPGKRKRDPASDPFFDDYSGFSGDYSVTFLDDSSSNTTSATTNSSFSSSYLDLSLENSNDFSSDGSNISTLDGFIEEIEEKEAQEDGVVSSVDQPVIPFSYKPNTWYPFKRDEKGRVQIGVPQSLEQSKKMIYILRDKATDSVLICKTQQGLRRKINAYLQFANGEGEKHRGTEEERRFLANIKEKPGHFDLGILDSSEQEEDLAVLESRVIDYYRGQFCNVYNRHKTEGASSSDEEKTVYAVPKEDATDFTPFKYYPYQKVKGQIMPQFSPGFEVALMAIKDELEGAPDLAYVIKELSTGRRYIGVSNDPLVRSKQHGYSAGYFDPEHRKYDPDRKGGRLYPEMAKQPDNFAFGLLPLKSARKIGPDQEEDYVFLKGIAQVEQFVIGYKESLFTQHGFNSNIGGGGPIGRPLRSSRSTC